MHSLNLPRFARASALTLALSVAGWFEAAAAPDLTSDIDLAYEKFVLPNGLTLLVHEDHKAPIVAVNVWYHVGSKNEKPGKTGFAHLFEHLMFNGSEHFDDDYFKAAEKVGATDLNGTTNTDRTNYFQNVPREALDTVLWLESDRMGHLLGVVDQARLDEQRGVVQNEKRQGENQPYGLAWELITKGTFPPGHPYSWTVIGSMEDLDAASLDDVREWFNTYYGAANVTLSIVGDITPEEARAKVAHYFGAIPAGPPLARHAKWIAKRTASARQIATDRVPQARLYKVWNIPEFGSHEADVLDLVAGLLTSGKTSRLYRRLVYEDQIASDVVAYTYAREIAGTFHVEATARPGVDLAEVERAVDEELARLLADGPTAAELERVKTEQLAGFIRGIERIGGFGGKSDRLAAYEVYTGDAGNYRRTLRHLQDATVDDVREAARAWLSDGVYILEVHPFPEYTTTADAVDRTGLPVPEIDPEPTFPPLQRATLPNGLKVVLAERHDVPLVNFRLLVDAGYAADKAGVPGTARLAMDMLDEGTESRTALEISDELARLGARLGARSDLDTSLVMLSALKANLLPSLELFADVVLNPAFPEADFQRLKQAQLDRIGQEQSEPTSIPARILPRVLYGEGHAYAAPLTGSGYVDGVRSLTRADLEMFHRAWFKADNATLIVVGDTTLAGIIPPLTAVFADWEAGAVPDKNLARVEPPPGSVVYLVDRPGSLQSVIVAGHLAPPEGAPQEIALEAMNQILGGSFTSRINMNLREDKHWSYGARTTIQSARGQRPFYVRAAVQTDRTAESMAEVVKELRGITGSAPVTEEEFLKTRRNKIIRLPGQWETIARIEASISNIVVFGYPDDYFQTYASRVGELSLEEVDAVARTTVLPDHLIWIVVGDRAKIEDAVRDLDLGELRFVDADGNPAL